MSEVPNGDSRLTSDLALSNDSLVDKRGAWRLYRTEERYVKTCTRNGGEVIVDVGDDLHDPSAGAESVLLDQDPDLPTESKLNSFDGKLITHDGRQFRTAESSLSTFVVASGAGLGEEFIFASTPGATRIVVERDGSQFLVVHYDCRTSPVKTVTAFVTPNVGQSLEYLNGVLIAAAERRADRECDS